MNESATVGARGKEIHDGKDAQMDELVQEEQGQEERRGDAKVGGAVIDNYVVVAGDSVGSIAMHFNMSVGMIVTLNRLPGAYMYVYMWVHIYIIICACILIHICVYILYMYIHMSIHVYVCICTGRCIWTHVDICTCICITV